MCILLLFFHFIICTLLAFFPNHFILIDTPLIDCLRYSRSRINAYKALSSPSLIAVSIQTAVLLITIFNLFFSKIQLSSKDPILTAFELAWQLRRLSVLEPEFKNEYLALRKQCQMFATTLLDHTRTSEELEVSENSLSKFSFFSEREILLITAKFSSYSITSHFHTFNLSPSSSSHLATAQLRPEWRPAGESRQNAIVPPEAGN